MSNNYKRIKMTTQSNKRILEKNLNNKEGTLIDSVKILADITRRDIEKSYNVNETQSTEAYYSNRYGWTLRRTID